MSRLVIRSVVVLSLLCVFAAPGPSATPEVAFETVTLRHLTAGEVAPLLAPYFQFVGKTILPEAPPERGALSSLVPEGIKLITAGHQSSRNLLVAGEAEAVAKLRGLLSILDAKPTPLKLDVTVWPAAPVTRSGWRETPMPSAPGIEGTIYQQAGKEAGKLTFPEGVEGEVLSYLPTRNLSGELVPLPAYRNWPQVLLCVIPRINADNTVTVSLGVGSFDDPEKPEEAVRQARAAGAGVVNIGQGEALVLVLARGDGAVTVMMRIAAE